MIELKNNVLSAGIAEFGATLSSVKELETGVEYIWNGDPTWWSGSAPILFPIVGALKGGKYQYEGKTYEMPQHGLVRKKDWSVVSSSETTAVFQTESGEETLAKYPFEFVLKAHFGLEGKALSVGYEVINAGADDMYFSIGSHPAFNVPFAGGHMENYYFHFSEDETIERNFLGDGVYLNETAPVFDNSRQIFLSKTLFDRGALILKHPASKIVSLKNSRNSKEVRVVTDGMPFLGLWAPSGAPFACIEPWYGIADNEDADGEFTTKEGIMKLESKGTYNTTYMIEII